MPDGRRSFEDPIVAFEVPVFKQKLSRLGTDDLAALAAKMRIRPERLLQIAEGAKPTTQEVQAIKTNLF